MSVAPGATLRAIRETKPLVHQITNYVVMNETANATLALGALPVMAHALEEVEEMVGLASALVLNIGTLSAPWIESMLRAGKAASARGIPVVLDPVGAGATRLRTDTAVSVRVVTDEPLHIVAAARNLALVPDEDPGAGEDPLQLAGVHLVVVHHLDGKEPVLH